MFKAFAKYLVQELLKRDKEKEKERQEEREGERRRGRKRRRGLCTEFGDI